LSSGSKNGKTPVVFKAKGNPGRGVEGQEEDFLAYEKRKVRFLGGGSTKRRGWENRILGWSKREHVWLEVLRVCGQKDE